MEDKCQIGYLGKIMEIAPPRNNRRKDKIIEPDTRHRRRRTFMFATRKVKLFAGIFCVALTSFEGTGGLFEDMVVFEAAVPFGWVLR